MPFWAWRFGETYLQIAKELKGQKVGFYFNRLGSGLSSGFRLLEKREIPGKKLSLFL